MLSPQARAAMTALSALLHLHLERVPARPGDDPDRSVRTAPLALAYFAGSQRGKVNLPLTAAAALIVASPVILFYIALQRPSSAGS